MNRTGAIASALVVMTLCGRAYANEPEVTQPGEAVAAPSVSPPYAKGPPRWILGLGVTHLAFSERSKIVVGGTADPGAQQKMSNDWGGMLQVGYVLGPQVAVVATVGTPATTTERGAGTIEAAGVLGRVQYVPVSGNILYLLPRVKRLQPYLGAGLCFSIITRARGSFLQNFRTSDSVGPELVAGAELAISRRVGLNAFYSKTFFNTTVRFDLPPTFGGQPGFNKLRLNPSMVGLGINLHL